MERIAVRPHLDAKESMQQQTLRSLLSRRPFLAGSAALAASTTLFGLDVDWAAPRGKERNLLAAACSPEKLKQALTPQDKYHPVPTIRDRAAWEGLRPQIRSTFHPGGEKSWYRTVKLDRSSNLVEISDSYILTEPVLGHHLKPHDRLQSNGNRKRPANTNLRPSHPAYIDLLRRQPADANRRDHTARKTWS
jgi:hypothetical protein